MSKTILISGASGMIGTALTHAFKVQGYAVRILSRGRAGDFSWDLSAGSIEAGALTGVDCVIHLAGEPIAQRWSAQARQRIFSSRADGTKLLADEILRQPVRPDFICASGINYYGYNPGQCVNEQSDSGDGFLADVCRAWEGASAPLTAAGVRVVHLRTGIVLSSCGGALAKLLLPFRLGIGGRIGSGSQMMSWIALSDLVSVYQFLVEHKDAQGAINAVAPLPVSNAIFTKTLAEIVRRPACLPLPSFAVRLIFGEMGAETLLADLSVQPDRLKQLGFTWQAPELRQAIEEALDEPLLPTLR